MSTLLYCNNLSLKENLEPVYTLTGLRRNMAKELNPECIVSTVTEVRADFSHDGYRLPTFRDMRRALADTAIVVDGPVREWVWQGIMGDSTLCDGFFFYDHTTDTIAEASTQGGDQATGFRVIAGVPDTVIITGSGDNLQKYAIALETVLMYDAFFEAGDFAKYYSGRNIHISNDTEIPEGAEVLLKSD